MAARWLIALTIVHVLWGCACPAHATEPTDFAKLRAFAVANAGLFSTELKAPPPTVTVRSRNMASAWVASYDVATGMFVSRYPYRVDEESLGEYCVRTGSFAGRSVRRGVVMRVTQQLCDTVLLEDTQGGLSLGSLNCEFTNGLYRDYPAESRQSQCRTINEHKTMIAMTPAQYRDWKVHGFVLEIDFAVGEGAKQELVLRDRATGTATVKSPVEITFQRWHVRGTTRAVRVLSSDGRTEFATFERELSAPAKP